ncbi:MAG: cysteine desulfurase [Chlamydiales bacterium]|nr:cysteine desulfurase [Chlamydiales bacterium]
MQTCVDFRKDFPMIREGLIYFDTAATAQKPQIVIDALCDFYSTHYGTVNRGVYKLARESTELYHEARKKIQRFIHARFLEEIIFTRGTTASLNLLARSYGAAFLRAGDAIMISEIEHHSNIVPWQMVCEERGSVLRIVPVNDAGELIFEEFLNQLDEKVKLVSIAHLSNVLGTLNPVKEIIDEAHRVGAHVCLDGAQAIAHLPLDVEALDVDFYAFSGHKLYGPTGVGVLYGKRELLEKMPPIEGGGDMIQSVTLRETTVNRLPVKFEAGTPMIAEVIALGAAIDYLSEIGMDTIASWEQELLAYATKKLSRVEGLKIIGTAAKKGAIINFVVEGTHPLDLATLLDCRGIAIRTGHHCSQPALERFGVKSTARISFGLYNTFEEIDQFVASLQAILSFLV